MPQLMPWIKQKSEKIKSSLDRLPRSNTLSKIAGKLRNPAYRKAFIASQINIGIPFQIRALMKARGWTQEKLAEQTGMLQPRISALLKPGKVRPNIETLRRIAEAFDCALLVRFAPFSELARWSESFDPESFNVPAFDEDGGFSEEAIASDTASYPTTSPTVLTQAEGLIGSYARMIATHEAMDWPQECGAALAGAASFLASETMTKSPPKQLVRYSIMSHIPKFSTLYRDINKPPRKPPIGRTGLC